MTWERPDVKRSDKYGNKEVAEILERIKHTLIHVLSARL